MDNYRQAAMDEQPWTTQMDSANRQGWTKKSGVAWEEKKRP